MILKKSFVTTRFSEIEVYPATWLVKRIMDQNFFKLDLRLCKMTKLSENCTAMFDFSSVQSVRTQPENTDEVTTSHLFSHPEFIIDIDVSLNDLDELKLSDLSPFPDLRRLDASLNQIESFSGVQACHHLTEVCLAYNKVEHLPVPALEKLKFLRRLDLKSNHIEDISRFPPLPDLTELDVGYNRLSGLDGVQVLRSLRTLNAQRNRIREIIGISACTELHTVNLYGNEIADPAQVTEVAQHLAQLRQLDVEENPVAMKLAADLRASLLSRTRIDLLNGSNILPLRRQIEDLVQLDPPHGDDLLKRKMKLAIGDAMQEKLRSKQRQHEVYVKFLHGKILALNEEMDRFHGKVDNDTDEWCTYVDTLSAKQAKMLTLGQIRNEVLVRSQDVRKPGQNTSSLRKPSDVLRSAAEQLE